MTALPLEDYPGPDDPDSFHDLSNDESPFRIEFDAQAEWALRKLAAIRAKRVENATIADAERQRITQWLEYANAQLDPDARYFEGLLADYLRRERQADPKRKSITLPHGSIKSRSSKAKARVEDEAAFIAWAQDNAPDLLAVKVTPAQAAINSNLELTDAGVIYPETGELVPGTRIDPETVSYTVETE